MQVRYPQRPVLFEVFQHIENAELVMLGGRINLCRNRIFFCHSYLHWSKSFAGSALLIEKPKKHPFPRPCRSLKTVYPQNHTKAKTKFPTRTLGCSLISRQGYAACFWLFQQLFQVFDCCRATNAVMASAPGRSHHMPGPLKQ